MCAFHMIPRVNSDYLIGVVFVIDMLFSVRQELDLCILFRRTASVSSNQSPLSFISLLCVRDCNLVS